MSDFGGEIEESSEDNGLRRALTASILSKVSECPFRIDAITV